MLRDDLPNPPFERTAETRRRDLRFFRTVMIVLAIAMVAAGGALLAWHPHFDISADMARRIGSLFVLAGVADTLVLYFWDRLFRVNR
jgi:ferric-dicitrate binding protein FerR (iron transport regulator)